MRLWSFGALRAVSTRAGKGKEKRERWEGRALKMVLSDYT